MKIDYNGHTFTICSHWGGIKTSDLMICRGAISDEPQMGELWFKFGEIKQFKYQLETNQMLPVYCRLRSKRQILKEYNAFREEYNYIVEKYEKLIALE